MRLEQSENYVRGLKILGCTKLDIMAFSEIFSILMGASGLKS